MTRIGVSESQANADALARRSSPYETEYRVSSSTAFDYRKREPRDLREAVHMARKAYADEMPEKMHDSAIGVDGTPRMNARAVGYIFGRPDADDAGHDPETGQVDLVGELFTPFRARLDAMAASSRESHRRHAAIVRRVTLGGQEGVEAAISEGIPYWVAGEVALFVLKAFLAQVSPLKVHAPRHVPIAESSTAA